MKKIVLIDPLEMERGMLVHRHYLRDWSGTFIAGYVPFMPYDLITAAAYVRQAGYAVDIIEASIHHISHAAVVEKLSSLDPDFVLVPSTYFTLDDDKRLATAIKARFPEVGIIFSGPLVTETPDIILQDGVCDFVALGELELPLVAILEERYDYNVAYRKDGRVVVGERTLLDMATLPLPARDLIDNAAYRYAIFNKRKVATSMVLSRGCAHGKCTFCHGNVYARHEVRARPLAALIEELNDIYYAHGIMEIFFRDQTFTNERQLVWDLCQYIIDNAIDIVWRANTRIDLLDEALLHHMRKAGCYQLSVGIESASQEVLDIFDKKIALADVRRVVAMIKAAGIEVLGNFIFGCPGDTEESMRAIVPFALELGVDYVQFNLFGAIQGSELYDVFTAGTLELPDPAVTQKVIRDAFVRFHFRPLFVLRQLSRVRSVYDAVFLFRMALNMVLARFKGF